MSETSETSPYHTDTLSYLTVNTSLGPVGCAIEDLNLMKEIFAAVSWLQIKYNAGHGNVAMMTCALAPAREEGKVDFVFTALLKERSRTSYICYQTIQLIKNIR